ncbi:MAG: hypothetical protein ACI8W3_003640, partial [Myxococcota bacterium]
LEAEGEIRIEEFVATCMAKRFEGPACAQGKKRAARMLADGLANQSGNQR